MKSFVLVVLALMDSTYGETYIYDLSRDSKALLINDCDSCSQVKVAECENWCVGDIVFIIGSEFEESNASENRTIISASVDCLISLDLPLKYYHRYESIYKCQKRLSF